MMWYNIWSYEQKKYVILGFVQVKKPSEHLGDTTGQAFEAAKKHFPGFEKIGVSLSNKKAVKDLIGRFPPNTWEILEP